MKEAAGEANMTVITIVLIGVIAAVGMLLIPNIVSKVRQRSCCTNAGGKMVSKNGGMTCGAISGSEEQYNAADYTSCWNATK